MSQYIGKKYIWILPVLLIFIVIFAFLKANDFKNISNVSRPEKPLSIIRIAVPDVSIGSNPSAGIAVVDYVYLNKMIEKEFEKDNIKVEWLFLKGAGPAINEALVNKQIDFAFIGDLGAIIGRSNQLDSKLLMAIARQLHGYLAVQPNQGYTNLEALKGKRIAVYHGTASQLSFDQVLDHYGLTGKDFRIVNLDYAAANAALVAKKIDAAWGYSGLLALQQRGIVNIPISSHDTGNSLGTTQMGLIADAQMIQQHPALVQRVVNTVLKSSYWVAQTENRDTAIEMVSKNANYPVKLYALSFKDQDFKVVYSPLLDMYYINHFKQGIRSALKAKLIRQSFNVDDWADPKFVERGISQLGYENIWNPAKR